MHPFSMLTWTYGLNIDVKGAEIPAPALENENSSTMSPLPLLENSDAIPKMLSEFWPLLVGVVTQLEIDCFLERRIMPCFP